MLAEVTCGNPPCLALFEIAPQRWVGLPNFVFRQLTVERKSCGSVSGFPFSSAVFFVAFEMAGARRIGVRNRLGR